ncbi:MAG: molybdenum cofactor synthesis domain containing protein [Pelosinus sp.]|jgi:molybdopterin molybdotransferase|nr:molybdenum cofactor synthesis domain containing protein [Pelosinus sp.]
MEFFQCVPLSEARDTIIDYLKNSIIHSETVHLSDALGRIAAEDIVAKDDVPAFSRSTVDGFAVQSADTFGASESASSLFSIIGEVAMGEEALMEIFSGDAVSIPTGGMLPLGADGVVMLEHTEQPDSNHLLVLKMVAPGENVVAKGEDIQGGTTIIEKGQRIAPQHIGVLAACGCATIPVCKKVEVAIISTGDELVDIEESLTFGQVRDVNSYALGALLLEMGCAVKHMGIVKDSYQKFFDVLSKAITNCQLVIISGGSSVGARDYTVKAIDALGSPGVLIHGVSIKPGKPTIFGMIDAVPVFGLPGHPAAALTVCKQLVKVAVRQLMGQEQPIEPIGIPASLIRNVASAPGRDDFINVRLSKQDGKYIVSPILGKSGLIRIMAQADGIVHIPSDKSGLYNGEIIEVLLNKSKE